MTKKAVMVFILLSLITSSVSAMKERVLVIGLDGATWDIMLPWIENGDLPNLKALMDSGSWGNLTSVYPYVSPVAWSSFMTGSNPGGHDVYGFEMCDWNTHENYITTSENVKGERFWNILGDNGKKVVVLNVLMTYPPEEVNGVMASGLLFGVYPKSMEPWFKDMGYIAEGRGYVDTPKDDFIKSQYESTDNRTNVALALMDKVDWDFFMILYSETDRMQHYLWGAMEDKDPKYGNAIRDYYQHVDSQIGRVLEKAEDENLTVIVLSDHGFGRQAKRVHLNQWLVDNGYLKVADTQENANAMRMVLLSGILKKTGLGEIVRQIMVMLGSDPTKVQPPKIEVDYSPNNTKAFTCGYYTGEIYLNKQLSPEEYTRVRSEIVSKLKELKDPDTGEKIISDVKVKEDLFKGPYVNDAPDIIPIPNDGYWFAGGFTYPWLFEKDERETGNHRPNGIIIVQGNKVRGGVRIEGASLIDVAPTILKLFNLNGSMDGKSIGTVLES